jgi:hypothetical protein
MICHVWVHRRTVYLQIGKATNVGGPAKFSN